MQITLRTEGGLAAFPGLNRPITVDSAELPAPEATELVRLVEQAKFFDRPAVASALPPGAADYREYTITVQDGDRQHTIRLADPVQDSDLQALLHFLRARS